MDSFDSPDAKEIRAHHETDRNRINEVPEPRCSVHRDTKGGARDGARPTASTPPVLGCAPSLMDTVSLSSADDVSKTPLQLSSGFQHGWSWIHGQLSMVDIVKMDFNPDVSAASGAEFQSSEVAKKVAEDKTAGITPENLQDYCVSMSFRSFESGAFSGLPLQKATDSNLKLPVQEESALIHQVIASSSSVDSVPDVSSQSSWFQHVWSEIPGQPSMANIVKIDEDLSPHVSFTESYFQSSKELIAKGAVKYKPAAITPDPLQDYCVNMSFGRNQDNCGSGAVNDAPSFSQAIELPHLSRLQCELPSVSRLAFSNMNTSERSTLEDPQGNIQTHTLSHSSIFMQQSEQIQSKRKIELVDLEDSRPVKRKKVQFFVKVGGRLLSMQQVLYDMSVKQLIESSCRKIGIKTFLDFYGVFSGITLSDEKFLSHYPIHRDSTIDIRSRLRAGQAMTFGAKFSKPESVLFKDVMLPRPLVNPIVLDKNGQSVKSVPKLRKYTRFNVKEVLVFFTEEHRKKVCYYGAFNAEDILFENRRVHLRSSIIGSQFSEAGCKKDYMKLHDIFSTLKTADGSYGQYFGHLLSYLKRCPAGVNSRSDLAIGFLINHPCLEGYQDRIKQIMLLDNLLFRLFGNPCTITADKTAIIAAMGHSGSYIWWDLLEYCPGMRKVLLHDSHRLANGFILYNPLFTDDACGCIHYSNNYFKHAANDLGLEEMEAAYSINVPDILVEVLEELTLYAINHTGFEQKFPEFLELILNDLADMRSGD